MEITQEMLDEIGPVALDNPKYTYALVYAVKHRADRTWDFTMCKGYTEVLDSREFLEEKGYIEYETVDLHQFWG